MGGRVSNGISGSQDRERLWNPGLQHAMIWPEKPRPRQSKKL